MQNESASQFSRREFLRRGAATAATAALGLAFAPALRAAAKKIPVGAQLYSVRVACKADFPGTLKAIAAIGYKGVEFAGYFDHTTVELKKMLDDSGLVACGTHAPYETVQGDALKKTVEFNHRLGNRFIIVPDMSAPSKERWVQRAHEFTDLAEKLKPENMRIGYHSHWHDFQKFDGQSAWNIFGDNSCADVILQLDTGNCAEGGGDPLAELKRVPGRTRSIHIKANGGGPEAVFGEDKLEWPAIFQVCETTGGTEWYVVEHETSKDPLDAVKRGFQALAKMGKV